MLAKERRILRELFVIYLAFGIIAGIVLLISGLEWRTRMDLITEWLKPEAAKAVIELITLFVAIAGFVHGKRLYEDQKNKDRDQKVKENEELARRNVETEREGQLKRFEKFQQMQHRYRNDPSIQEVLRWLYPGQYHSPNDEQAKRPQVTMPTEYDKMTFMGFYEEVAIMVNSGIIAAQAAYYTFGCSGVL